MKFLRFIENTEEGWCHFNYGTIRGLGRIGLFGELIILAIENDDKGNGDYKKFRTYTEKNYYGVAYWHTLNTRFEQYLKNNGYIKIGYALMKTQ